MIMTLLIENDFHAAARYRINTFSDPHIDTFAYVFIFSDQESFEQ